MTNAILKKQPLRFERLPESEGYGYAVFICVPDKPDVCFGKALRGDGNTWTVSVQSGAVEGVGEVISSGEPLTFEAATDEAMMAHLREHIESVQLTAKVMTNESMYMFTAAQLKSVNRLAFETDTLPGYISGLSRALAQVIDEDVKRVPGNEEHVIQAFIGGVQEELTRRRLEQAAKRSILSVFERFVLTDEERIAARDEDAAEVKH